MFQIITAWNSTQPNKVLREKIKTITLRGYNANTFLTGEFAAKIANQELKPLSVSDIADTLCPLRRDLYFKKGKNKLTRIKEKITWGNRAGIVTENFIYDLFSKFKRDSGTGTYSNIINDMDAVSIKFKEENSRIFDKLKTLKTRPEEDSDWLLNLLNFNGRMEVGLKSLHEHLLETGSEMDIDNLRINQGDLIKLNPSPKQIGISKKISPDFIIEDQSIIGDVKTGFGGFQDRYLLTCTGYALAYENERGKGHNIDFGIIYFFPTRHSNYVQPISFSQVYIFPIDDNLRKYFIDIRDAAYNIISKESPPEFPKDTKNCSRCKFYDVCKREGLQL